MPRVYRSSDSRAPGDTIIICSYSDTQRVSSVGMFYNVMLIVYFPRLSICALSRVNRNHRCEGVEYAWSPCAW